MDKSLDLSVFMEGGKKKSSQSKKSKLKYKQEWYKKNSKDVRGYNKKYYEEHKNEFKIKRKRNSKKK